jgi:hypothetical protein
MPEGCREAEMGDRSPEAGEQATDGGYGGEVATRGVLQDVRPQLRRQYGGHPEKK